LKGTSLADVVFETKDFKVFLDFMDCKDATYHMDFQTCNISIQCIANDGRYVGELIRRHLNEYKYACGRPIRISFNPKTRESLRELCKKVTTVTIEGSNVVFGKDQYVVKSQYMNEPLPPIIEDTTERFLELTLSRDEFSRVVKLLRKGKIEFARLNFLIKSRMLEVSISTELLSLWSFKFLTSSVYFSGVEFDVYFAQEEHPISPHVIDSFYNVNDLVNMIEAVKYHYGREIMFSLSLLQDKRLLFESTKDGVTQRCTLHSI
jgi:hypothetical protein